MDFKKLNVYMVNQRLTIHLHIFSVSVAMLILQLSFTRILSVAQWYHFVYLVISIALFGMGAAGIFQDYMDSLSENGVLSITRYVLPPPRESVRIVSVAIEALEKNGIERPEEHISVIRSWGTITILIKKSMLTWTG